MSSFTAIIITTVILAGATAGRDLRPSDHGLSFQSPPPANSPTDMKSFFNTNNNSSSSSSSSSSYNSPLNFTDSLPPEITTGNGGGRLGKALVWASLVCGVTGGVLLLVSVLLYLFNRNRRRRRNLEQNDSFRFDHNNVANKVELVQNS